MEIVVYIALGIVLGIIVLLLLGYLISEYDIYAVPGIAALLVLLGFCAFAMHHGHAWYVGVQMLVAGVAGLAVMGGLTFGTVKLIEYNKIAGYGALSFFVVAAIGATWWSV